MNQTFAKEQGRSMVEMLGVLAIIGVLSVAGIAGYSIAMRNYRANEIVNAVAKLYVLGQAQNQGNGDQELPYTTIDTKLPSGVSALKYNADKSISITITDEDDCKMVKNKLGDKAGGCTETTGAYTLTVSFGQEEEESGAEEISEGTPCVGHVSGPVDDPSSEYICHNNSLYFCTYSDTNNPVIANAGAYCPDTCVKKWSLDVSEICPNPQ